MLNDNLLFPTYGNMLPGGRYYRNCDPFERYYSERDEDYLAELKQQERNRRYQAALEEQAYLEALERERQNRLAEERRRKQYRHLLELERRRRQKQEEEERRRQQYLAHLSRKRQQQQLREERIRNVKAAALEEFQRKEEMRRRMNLVNQTDPLTRIIRGPDENLYRILFDQPTTDSRRSNYDHRNLEEGVTSNEAGEKLYVKPTHRKNQKVTAKMDCSDDMSVSRLNINKSDKNIKQDYKKKKVVPRKILKSSILIGDVEDASDSECEDEYSDYMHTRRPQPGQWIEPIACMANYEGFRK